MTKISKTLLVLGSVTILSGCGMKSNFSKFKEAVGKIKAHEFKTCEVKVAKEKYAGTLKSIEFLGVKIEGWEANDLNEKTAEAYGYVNLFMMTADSAKGLEEQKAEEGEKVVYYVNNLGMFYQDKDGNKTKIEWNKYGLVTSYSYDNKADDSKDYSLSVSYKK